MNHRFHLKAPLIIAAMLAFPVAHAASLTKADYKAGKIRVTNEFKAAKTACASLAGNAQDICIEEAKGKENVARAELDYARTGKAGDGTKVEVAKADAAFAVAREKCDDKAGNVKDVCVAEAKAAQTSALSDAKMGKQIDEAVTDATADKRAADYKVASEKCDVLAGESKDTCMAAAKAKFGKS